MNFHFENGLLCLATKHATKWYNNNGERHREDGPAIITRDENLWFICGERVTSYQEFQDLTGHSDQYIMYLKFKYGEMD